MHPTKIVDEFIYNRNKDIAMKLTTKNVFSGEFSLNSNTYPYFEVWLLLSPHCDFKIGDEDFSANEGDIFIFSQGENRKIISADSNGCFLVLQIDGDSFKDILPINILCDNKEFFKEHGSTFKNKITNKNPSSKVIRDLMHKISEAFTYKKAGYEIEAFQYCCSTILAIARETSYGNYYEEDDSNASTKKHRSIKRAIDYIDMHINEELTLDNISAIAELSPNYLSNIFREYTGTRLWDYITEKRILVSTRLLIENPTDSIISIAIECGFNNCPNFNRAFKKYTGMTPIKYRNSILRQEKK